MQRLHKSNQEVFLCFLCEMLHPAVRPDQQEVEMLLPLFNNLLATDDFEILESFRISEYPVYAARLKVASAPPSLRSAKEMVRSFNAEYLNRQITRLEVAILNDPELAIGTAKELVETCCLTILHERGRDIQKNFDLSKLVKETCRELKLTPDDIPDEAKASDVIKRLLSNLSTVTQGLAELRNSYGTGHGKSNLSRGL